MHSVKVAVSLPVCASCESGFDIEPVIIDFDYFTMRFVVHRDFKKAVMDANATG